MAKLSLQAGAFAAVTANHWAKGGAGATDLGNAVIRACELARSTGSLFRCDVAKEVSLLSFNTLCLDFCIHWKRL